MMISRPSVFGLIAVDQNWNICYGDDNKSVIDHPSVDKSIKDLDRALLRKFLRETNTLFVVGENTAKQMGHLLDGLNVMISKPDTTNLATHAFRLAFERDMFNICVLGGRAVYNAFIPHYQSVTVHKFHVSEDLSGKKVFGEVISQPDVWFSTIFHGELNNVVFEMGFPNE